MQLCRDDFDDNGAVDGAFGAIESNCTSWSKSSRSLQKLHDKGVECVFTISMGQSLATPWKLSLSGAIESRRRRNGKQSRRIHDEAKMYSTHLATLPENNQRGYRYLKLLWIHTDRRSEHSSSKEQSSKNKNSVLLYSSKLNHFLLHQWWWQKQKTPVW